MIDRPVHASGTPPVVVRELGDRKLWEVPASEIQALMSQLRGSEALHDDASVKRAFLGAYGRKSLTKATSEHLDQCETYRWTQG